MHYCCSKQKDGDKKKRFEKVKQVRTKYKKQGKCTVGIKNAREKKGKNVVVVVLQSWIYQAKQGSEQCCLTVVSKKKRIQQSVQKCDR